MKNNVYQESGVSVEKNERVVSSIKSLVESTHSEEMKNNPIFKLGNYSGVFPFPGNIPNNDFYLTATMDGVGTKSELVKESLGDGGFINLGHDIVNHCINDTLAGGGHPLFFLDYFASSNLSVKQVYNFIEGVSEACKKGNVVLLGGETAEMPDIYNTNCCDLVGCMVGYQLTSEAKNRLKNEIKPGDVIIGFPSNGLHTNGYSAVRRGIKSDIFNSWDKEKRRAFIEECCKPHRSYLDTVSSIIKNNITIKSHIHITGGGWLDNPPRVIPDNISVNFNWNEWKENQMPQFYFDLQEITDMAWSEMLQVFNCGVGYMIIISKEDSNNIEKMTYLMNLGGFVIGHTEERNGEQLLFN